MSPRVLIVFTRVTPQNGHSQRYPFADRHSRRSVSPIYSASPASSFPLPDGVAGATMGRGSARKGGDSVLRATPRRHEENEVLRRLDSQFKRPLPDRGANARRGTVPRPIRRRHAGRRLGKHSHLPAAGGRKCPPVGSSERFYGIAAARAVGTGRWSGKRSDGDVRRRTGWTDRDVARIDARMATWDGRHRRGPPEKGPGRPSAHHAGA